LSKFKKLTTNLFLIKNFIQLFICLGIGLLVPPKTYSWGFFGHRYINYHSVFLLPPEMISFYKMNIQYLEDHSVDPDKRRYAIPEEAPRHYIDMDQYGKFPFLDLPKKWNEAVDKFSEDTLHAHGIAPWWIMIMQNRLRKAFEERNADAVLKLSAEIGHYIADVHVPLHASSNHNGQKTDQLGIHGFWESRLPELYAESEYDLFIGKATFIENQLNFIWDRIYESANASDSVLKIEKVLSLRIPSHKRFNYEDRNGVLMRQFSTLYANRYHDSLKGMVERRMAASIYAISSFWYSAWVEAGQPSLSDMGKGNSDSASNKEMELLQFYWLGNSIIGRSCTN
jgi:hypothetical protein